MTMSANSRLICPKLKVMASGLRAMAGNVRIDDHRMTSDRGQSGRMARSETARNATSVPTVTMAHTTWAPTGEKTVRGVKSSAAAGGYVNGSRGRAR